MFVSSVWADLMFPDTGNALTESERIELERVLGALAKWPRLSHLLAYMGEKLSSGDADQLNEYNIATEVLGRSKTVFSAGEDAIARVETHRLRKRLTEFYEREGRDHPIHVTLPAGSYIPVFIHKPQGLETPGPPGMSHASGAKLRGESGRPSFWIGRPWKHIILVSGVILGVTTGYFYIHQGAPSARSNSGTSPAPVTLPPPLQPGAAVLPIRLLAGYSGPP